MTTTLRPNGPATHTATERAQTYAILDNGRPVGGLRLRATLRGGAGGAWVGRLAELHVEPDERRRGRATVALLAAEEVARGWGCRVVEARVPVDATQALRLASALGYREHSRFQCKHLGAAPELPAPTRVRAMTTGEFGAWVTAGEASFVDHSAGAGLSRDEARADYHASLARQLPDGPGTPGAVLRVLEHGEEAVGTLWLGTGGAPHPGLSHWVWDVEVAAHHRGAGHGRTLLLVAEREALATGATRLGLNVHTENTVARALYRSLGYEDLVLSLRKPLA